MAKIEDIQKVVSLGSDINKLQDEVKSLKSLKEALGRDVERVKRDTTKLERDVNKNILASRQALEDEISTKTKEANKRETETNKKLKVVSIREEESLAIEQEWVKLREDKRKLSQERKVTEEARVSYLEKTHLIELRTKQLEKTLQELGVKTEEPKKAKKKK